MDEREKKRRRFELRAVVVKALAHPVRLMLVDALRDGERCVCDLAEDVGSERTGISKHLGILKQAGIVADRKEGLKIFYRLACPCIVDFFTCIEDVLHCRVNQEREALSS